MKFSTDTRISPEVAQDSIPVIHGQNYYIDDQGFVSTYNNYQYKVFDIDNADVEVSNIKPITEFIYVVNNKLAYKTAQGLLVTEIPADKEKYRGGFQGIVGFNETEANYQYLNNNEPTESSIVYTGRINDSKQLEIQVGDKWLVPLGEFRCYISDTFYNINYTSVLPNSFGETFEVTLASWKSVEISPTTNYIRDMFVSGNTLYLSTRLNIIGSEPFNWSNIDTADEAVLWSEDTRLNGSYFQGSSTSSYFYLVNYNTSSIYYINGEELKILQEYQHKLPMLGTGIIDKFMLAVVDKEAITILSAYVSLNTWLIKGKSYFKLNQLSAYEDMVTQYIREEVTFVQDLNSLVVKSTQRQTMMFYLLGYNITSGCFTSNDIIAGEYSAYVPEDGKLYKYYKVEDNGEYNPIDKEAGVVSFDSFIYIGSDLEPDCGGSTMRDTEIIYEGKIAIVDGEEVSTEASGDLPADPSNLPVRTDQVNPDNWWYLYTKTLRYPISYTDWVKISLMSTTRIFNIKLAEDMTKKQKDKR